jgi:Amt family ammonium transporter
MALNGILAGLVGITAGADVMGAWGAVLVGLTSGIIVVFSIILFDKVKVDDPVGAISVHGVCGVWGTLCVAIFGLDSITEAAGITFGVQLLGAASVSIFAFVFSLVVFSIVKAIFGIRVSEEEEFEGLDISEHGQEAYPDFSVSTR